eukprot:3941216-Rhodomonas_salina.3
MCVADRERVHSSSRARAWKIAAFTARNVLIVAVSRPANRTRLTSPDSVISTSASAHQHQHTSISISISISITTSTTTTPSTTITIIIIIITAIIITNVIIIVVVVFTTRERSAPVGVEDAIAPHLVGFFAHPARQRDVDVVSDVAAALMERHHKLHFDADLRRTRSQKSERLFRLRPEQDSGRVACEKRAGFERSILSACLRDTKRSQRTTQTEATPDEKHHTQTKRVMTGRRDTRSAISTMDM